MRGPETTIPDHPADLEEWLAAHEERSGPVKPSARARICWDEEAGMQKTPCSIVYLHGFKASHGEGEPTHRHLARTFGCNLFLSRLSDHGLQTESPLQNMTADTLINSAVVALEIGKRIGDRVILMGTSTGASLALCLAARPAYSASIAGLLLYSPLIRFFGLKNYMLTTRTGRKLLGIIPGRNYTLESPTSSEQEDEIWYDRHKLQGLLELGVFVQRHMTPETFASVTCPSFVGYYYKNRHKQDSVVSAQAVQTMTTYLGTPESRTYVHNFPEAATHVLPSGLSCNSLEVVQSRSEDFINSLNCPGRD